MAYTQVMQNNPDGTVSIIQVDPSTVVQLADGSGQTVRALSALRVSIAIVDENHSEFH